MFGTKIKAFIVWLLFFYACGAAHAKLPCAQALAKLDRLIQSNTFEVRRDIYHYTELFPQTFIEQLASLKKEDHWIDAGSGEGFAVEDLMNKTVLDSPSLLQQMEPSFRKPRRVRVDSRALEAVANKINGHDISEKPQVTAVAVKMERPPPQKEKLQFKTGRYFEDIPNEEFSPGDMITDLYGVMSYSPKVDEVLRKYHRILKMNGRAYIFIGDYVPAPRVSSFLRVLQVGESGWDAPFAKSQVKRKDGSTVTLLDWVFSLKGFKASVQHREVEAASWAHASLGPILRSTLVLEKIAPEFDIPNLRLVQTTDGKPPVRMFEEVIE